MQKFSIIIPTYNSGASLVKTMDSIVLQTFDDVEVFIMDGDSTDDTLAIAKTYCDKIPHLLIVSEEDQGIYEAMNKAMDKATGEWLLFLGSDDTLYDSTVLQEVKNAIDKTNAKVVYGDAKIIGDTGWAKDGEIYAGEFTTNKLLNTNICHQAIFYNRDFVKKEIGIFNLKYSINADWDFNLRCWAKKPFDYLDIIITKFMAGGVSSNSTDAAIVEDFVFNVCNYYKVDPFHPLLNNPTFIFYKRVVELQKSKYPLRFTSLKFKNRILKKLKAYFGIY